MIDHLVSQNPHISIYSIHDSLFSKYGKVLNSFDFTQSIQIMDSKDIPAEGNCYVAADGDLMKTSIFTEISERFYASMPVQIGYCNGKNSKLNALEYHKSSEIDVAVTDLVLLLSHIGNIKQNRLSTSQVEAFYVPAGTACELYATTLHFAPCKTDASGFKSIIVLPEDTNEPLSTLPTPKCEEDHLIWMRNKWLIAHAESIPASKGAFIGIEGPNLEIKF